MSETSPQIAAPPVTIRGLVYHHAHKCIFDGVDLDIPAGKITAIMGPSGTGKTTLLKLIGAQLSPQAGRVTIADQDVHAMPRQALLTFRRHLGLLFQSGALFTDMTVFDNVAFPLREHTQLSERLVALVVKMKLEFVGLRGAAALMPSQLSGGMARRVALARAIALDPRLMLYDEPFTGQDPISMGVLVRLIRRLNDFLGTTTVVVSHDVQETLAIADKVYLLAQGKVIADGTAEELCNSQHAFVQQFLHGLADGAVPFHYPAPRIDEDLANA